jgi:hypothetical protein
MRPKRPPLTLGIYNRSQYLKMGSDRRYSGGRVAYNLLRVGEEPTADEIRVFEDICFSLSTSNGIWRTTFRDRFGDVDAASVRLMQAAFQRDAPIQIQDRAVSSGLTSCQWAKRLFEVFPNARLEASDLMTELLEVLPDRNGCKTESFIAEPGGAPLQYIRPPFVVALNYPESWRNPLLRYVAARARTRYKRLNGDHTVVPISCIHPEAQVLARVNPNFTVQVRSVFERTPAACDVVRTMNILNLSYFSTERLQEAAAVIFESVRPDGIWIVGKTTEDDFTNHTTFFRRGENGWEVLERTGSGSEIEELVLASPRETYR